MRMFLEWWRSEDSDILKWLVVMDSLVLVGLGILGWLGWKALKYWGLQ